MSKTASILEMRALKPTRATALRNSTFDTLPSRSLSQSLNRSSTRPPFFFSASKSSAGSSPPGASASSVASVAALKFSIAARCFAIASSAVAMNDANSTVSSRGRFSVTRE